MYYIDGKIERWKDCERRTSQVNCIREHFVAYLQSAAEEVDEEGPISRREWVRKKKKSAPRG